MLTIRRTIAISTPLVLGLSWRLRKAFHNLSRTSVPGIAQYKHFVTPVRLCVWMNDDRRMLGQPARVEIEQNVGPSPPFMQCNVEYRPCPTHTIFGFCIRENTSRCRIL